MMVEDVVANASYSRRPPSPPMIPVPVYNLPAYDTNAPRGMPMKPSFDNVDYSQLTEQECKDIVGDKIYIAYGSAEHWQYEQRRRAQRILEFMYLGPFNSIRDCEYLREEGITMIVAIRDSRMTTSIPSLEKAVAQLNVVAECVGVASLQDLIHKLPEAIRAINDHLLAVRQNPGLVGKVLITCETGNDRSAIMIAAYIMAVYGKTLKEALQFINLQRFCCIFDEDAKRLLLSWEDILKARSTIARFRADEKAATTQSKRRLDEVDEMDDDVQDLDLGEDESRRAFVPFVDRDTS